MKVVAAKNPLAVAHIGGRIVRPRRQPGVWNAYKAAEENKGKELDKLVIVHGIMDNDQATDGISIFACTGCSAAAKC